MAVKALILGSIGIFLLLLFIASVIFIVFLLVRKQKSIEATPVQGVQDQLNSKSFSENIKELRCKSNLSQEYVAEKIGVSRQAVSKWETGLSEPSTANLRALSELYQVTIDELINPKTL